MVSANRSKSIDKHEVCRKATLLLKKQYGSTVPKQELPVLETMLYAVCLEYSTLEAAHASYARLLNTFHDLNEVRVSAISELSPVFGEQSDPEWRAARVKSVLQFVFETNYAFDFESLKRKTADLAVKQLAKIPVLSSFVKSYVMQHCLGSHVLPIDDRMHQALVWLKLAEHEETSEQAGEHLRSHVRKADAPLFCHLLGCLSNDPKRQKAFAHVSAKGSDNEAGNPIARLDILLKKGDAPFLKAMAKSKDKEKERDKKPAAKSAAKSTIKSSAKDGAKEAGKKTKSPHTAGSKKR